MKKSIILGTAGHIDHGKSSLIKALTGTNPDRLKEEKERGITVDLGFAFMENNEIFISFVDVPGHEKLIKNMIAGATGFDACLFAVDLTEGIKPQTVEHANILKTLDVDDIIIAATKTDLIEQAEAVEKMSEIKHFFIDKGFSKIRTAFTSIYKPETIDDLKKLIFQIASDIEQKRTDLPFLLRIDRIFSAKGFGTIVTGTCIFGEVAVGNHINLLPQNKKIRVKGIHVNNKSVTTAFAGQRIALNLGGISKETVRRGNLLSEDKSLIYTKEFFASVEVYNNKDELALKHNKNISIYMGTAHMNAKLILLNKKIIKNGDKAYCRLKIEEPYAPFVGEKFIIRGKSPQISIAGGKVLSISKFNFEKSDLINALELLDLSENVGFYNFFVSKHKNGVKIPPLMQFTENFSVFFEFLKSNNIVFDDNFLVSKEYLSEILLFFDKKIEKEEEILIDQIKNFGNFPKKIISELEQDLIKKAASAGFSLEGKILKKKKKNDFDLLCEKILQQMKHDITLSNSSLISDRFKIDAKTSQNCIKYLNNRNLIIQLDKNVWISKEYHEMIMKKIRLHCLKNKYIDIKSLREIVNAPRKILVPILDYLDKTGNYINKDNKRYLKK